ncbi:hypothetical protein ACF08W_31525 [Streptomyces sp. NPDC015144]|uniref:hypothetical protein n=1 Tax=Streptomyces sp. NPDC015144 TaxID=3364944 RepID=UPI0036F5B080
MAAPTNETPDRGPAQVVADVIREAVTCEREQCRPEDHQRFVDENLRIATERINNS